MPEQDPYTQSLGGRGQSPVKPPQAAKIGDGRSQIGGRAETARKAALEDVADGEIQAAVVSQPGKAPLGGLKKLALGAGIALVVALAGAFGFEVNKDDLENFVFTVAAHWPGVLAILAAGAALWKGVRRKAGK